MLRTTLAVRARAVLVTAVVLVAAVGVASGAELLKDDFNSSSGKWFNLLEDNEMIVQVGGGNLNLNNVSQYLGEYYYPSGEIKKDVFTISYVLKSVTPANKTAGLLFCKQGENNAGGYVLTIWDSNVVGVLKVTQTTNSEGTSIGWGDIFQQRSQFVNSSGDNKLTVSKNGSKFTVFVNDEFVGEFTDASYASGEVAFFVQGGTNATFGTIQMTDEFTEGGIRTSYKDDFSDPNLKYWEYPSDAYISTVSVVDGAMRINNNLGRLISSSTYVEIDIQDDFEVNVDAKHLSGGTASYDLFGIILMGDLTKVVIDGEEVNIYPTVQFGITGNRRYGVWQWDESFATASAVSVIKGSGETNKLAVIKKSNASAYEFIVNGEPVSVNHPIANFKITKVGVFAMPDSTLGITAEFDNFYAGPIGGDVSISFGRDRQQSIRNKTSAIRNPNANYYDLRGRKRFSANQAAQRGNVRTRAAGVYVNENGREVMIRKGRR